MLQRIAGLILVFLCSIILTIQAFAGEDASVLAIIGGMVFLVFGAVICIVDEDSF